MTAKQRSVRLLAAGTAIISTVVSRFWGSVIRNRAKLTAGFRVLRLTCRLPPAATSASPGSTTRSIARTFGRFRNGAAARAMRNPACRGIASPRPATMASTTPAATAKGSAPRNEISWRDRRDTASFTASSVSA